MFHLVLTDSIVSLLTISWISSRLIDWLPFLLCDNPMSLQNASISFPLIRWKPNQVNTFVIHIYPSCLSKMYHNKHVTSIYASECGNTSSKTQWWQCVQKLHVTKFPLCIKSTVYVNNYWIVLCSTSNAVQAGAAN